METSPSGVLALDLTTERTMWLVQQICLHLCEKGFQIVPFTDDSLHQFCRLGLEKREEIRANLVSYLKILDTNEPVPEPVSISEEVTMVRKALSVFSLRVKTFDWSFIEAGDIIEIYTADGIQIYRNFEFFRQCSYDLMSLLSYEWHELYERPSSVTDGIYRRVGEVMAGGRGNPQPYGLLPHTLRESRIDAKRVFSVEMKKVLPVFDASDSVAGFLHTVGSTLLSVDHSADKIRHI